MKSFALLFLLSFVSFTYIIAQETKESDLKVGLVLSGGGAKGYAHIGVLKALEEANVTIDYIGGTSMGSIVGGLYASGYKADEIAVIAHDLGFENYLEEEIQRPNKPFYIKENDDKYIIKIPVQNNSLSLPSGITQGVQVMNKISKYTQHVSHIKDFNHLPIPFLCIATNLENGEAVLLDKGDLAQSMRASAAYPTVIKPIIINNKLLVDGGLVNNFPVDEVKNMGADLLIGVDVGSKELYKKEELQSVVNILEQMVSYQMVNAEEISKKNKVDIYINPVDEKYNTFSFNKIDSIIQLGYDKALPFMDEFKAIAKKQNRVKKPTSKVVVLNSFIIKSIQFSGNKNYNNGYLLDKMQIKLGKIISFDNLANGIDRLWATNNFNQIQHKVVMDGGEGHVFIELKENKNLSKIQLGGHFDDLFKAGVLVNFSSRQLVLGNDIFSADAIIGENLRYNVNYFVDNGINLSTKIQSMYQSFDYNTDFSEDFSTFSPDVNYKNLSYKNFTNKINFQFVYRDNYAIGIGAKHQYIRVKDNYIQAENDIIEKMNVESLYSFIKIDTYDHRMFPKSGVFFTAMGQWHMAAQDNLLPFNPYLQGQVEFGYAFPIGKEFTIQLESEIGLSFSDNTHPYLDFQLGGSNDNQLENFRSLYGFPFAYMGGKSYLKSGINLKYELTKNVFAGVMGHVAKVEDNFLNEFSFFKDSHVSYGMYFGAKTLAGPIEISLSKSPEIDHPIFSLKYGYWF